MEFNIFGLKVAIGGRSDNSNYITEEVQDDLSEQLLPTKIEEDIKDNTGSELLEGGQITGISEEFTAISPFTVRKMLETNEIDMRNLLESLRQDFGPSETFKEDEEMARDPIVGSAMELMADDCALVEPTTGKIVYVQSSDKRLEKFLNTFLQENVRVDQRAWEWLFEIVKHGDFKLRRREFNLSRQELQDVESTPNDKKMSAKGVYYENVLEPDKVSRIEYMGNVLGYLDEDEGDAKTLENPDSFVHFLSPKLPKRKKIKVTVTRTVNGEKKKENITCYKVHGVSLVDNARYVFRIVKLLDDMIIMSRVARSTQFNIVKVEVGNAGPSQTQQILSDVRRRVEGSTRMSKGKGMRSDPSPIPVNSNVYIPTREGKGDVNIESVNDSVDIKSIVDVDYFKNKEFATIKVPKAYLGFEDELPGSMGNSSLVRLDLRYARTVQKAQNVFKMGIHELCNNYLRFRGRVDEVNQFKVVVREVTTAEDSNKIEDFIMRMGAFDALNSMSETYADYIDKGKLLAYVLSVVGIDPSAIASDLLTDTIKAMKSGKKSPKPSAPEGEEESDKDSKDNSGDGEDDFDWSNYMYKPNGDTTNQNSTPKENNNGGSLNG